MYGGGAGGFWQPPSGPPPGAGAGGFYNAPGGFAPPSGPPPQQGGNGFYGQPGGFAPPSGPPPAFGHHSTPSGGAGGFAPPSGPPHGHGGPGGFAPPSGPPANGPGGFAPPAGPPPSWSWGQQQGPVGPSHYQHMPVRYERPTGQVMENGMRYEYSSMTGKRKALLIGINYVGSKAQLRGCWNDIDNIKNFITTRANYKNEDIVVLSDRERNPKSQPTRANMTAAMHWLVAGAKSGDALFFHYSGHGGQAPAHDGDEADGYNETIIPVDYERTGQMEDDELHAILVRPLPIGCRLTAVFDSCHSGTALDLPYVYSTSGKIKEPNVIADVGKGVLGAAMDYARGDLAGVVKGLFSTAMTAKNTKSAEEITKRTRSSGADVIMLSGCKDSQTSADTVEASKATGAASYALVKVLNKYPRLTYCQLLNAIRDELVSRYSQKPQLSSSHPIDLNLIFTL